MSLIKEVNSCGFSVSTKDLENNRGFLEYSLNCFHCLISSDVMFIFLSVFLWLDITLCDMSFNNNPNIQILMSAILRIS